MIAADILYLDFDGVTHPAHVKAYRVEPHVRLDVPGHALFESAPTLAALLEPYPELQLVLSTSWCVAFGRDAAKNALPESLRTRVIGTVYDEDPWAPLLMRGAAVRGDVARRAPRRWLAVDDDDRGWEGACDHLVVTSPALGLRCPETTDLLEAALQRTFGPRKAQ